jgi:hypothetical protein
VFSIVPTASANPKACPIAGLTWLLLYPQPKDATKTTALKSPIEWALTTGKAAATELGYLPLDDGLVTKAKVVQGSVGWVEQGETQHTQLRCSERESRGNTKTLDLNWEEYQAANQSEGIWLEGDTLEALLVVDRLSQ